jgi:methylglutaconyl-CoA hydratase
MEYIEISISNRVAAITMNRPEKRNALNPVLVDELTQAFLQLKESDCRIIILKGRGKAFSAGADLEYLQQLQQNTFEENLTDSTRLKTLFELIYTHPLITIAQVEGPAIAGGCGLATVCDFTYSTPDAQFGYTEVKIGFIPAIVMVFLLRKIGEAQARKLLLTGNLINAAEAQNMHLITGIFESDTIEQEVNTIAAKLASETSPQAIAHTKLMIAEVFSMKWEEALTYAANQNAIARATEDCKKGISAFLNKEKMGW